MSIISVGNDRSFRAPLREEDEAKGEIDAAYVAGMAARNPLPAHRPALPLSACPYAAGTQLARYWCSGWREADRHYGSLARWPVQRLPAAPDETEVSGE